MSMDYKQQFVNFVFIQQAATITYPTCQVDQLWHKV